MNKNTWEWQLKNRISKRKMLQGNIGLTKKENDYFNDYNKTNYPFAVTPYYFSLIDKTDPDDPIRKQCVPQIEETVFNDYESLDPLSECDYSPVPGVVHRYKNRVLLLVTDTCAVYCRHCFRRTFAGNNSGCINRDNLNKAINYITMHPEIKELLLSGGDPLTLDDKKLSEIFDKIVNIKRELIIRICTRVPVVMPHRIDSKLIENIKRMGTVWIVTQFNHYKEITEQSKKAVKELVESGIPVLNQTVLLKGVNDKKETLVKLFTKLIFNRIKPYYIFQGDLACGTGHFRTNLRKGLELIKEVFCEVSGLARPFYAVDLPEGGGKIILDCNHDYNLENGFYKLKDKDDKVYFYPEE